jgi:hypothetical protein
MLNGVWFLYYDGLWLCFVFDGGHYDCEDGGGYLHNPDVDADARVDIEMI